MRRHTPSVFTPNITNPQCLQDDSTTAVLCTRYKSQSVTEQFAQNVRYERCTKTLFSIIPLSELPRIKISMIFMDVMGFAL